MSSDHFGCLNFLTFRTFIFLFVDYQWGSLVLPLYQPSGTLFDFKFKQMCVQVNKTSICFHFSKQLPSSSHLLFSQNDSGHCMSYSVPHVNIQASSSYTRLSDLTGPERW